MAKNWTEMIPWMREKFAEKRAKWRSKRTPKADQEQDTTRQIGLDESRPAASATTAGTSTRRSSNHVALAGHVVVENRSNSAQPSAHLVDYAAGRTENIHVARITRHMAPPQPGRVSKLKSTRRSSSSSTCDSGNSSTNNSSIAVGAEDNKTRIKVRIISPNARVLTFQTDVHKRLSELKNEIILELSEDSGAMPLFATDARQLTPRYRLFRAEYHGHELNETLTLQQLHLTENDTLVLVPRRNNLAQMTLISRETQAPRHAEIEAATRNIPVQLNNMPMVDINEIFQQSNLQFDVRKVLISLAQASAAVIGAGPYASRLIAMLKQKLVNKRNYQNDTLQCLIDMGFGKEKAEYALKTNNGVYSSALEWLILRQGDDTPLEEAAMTIQKSQSILSPSGILTNNSLLENTEALMEIVRIYSHRDIPPTPEAIAALVEMGFAEPEVLNALKKTCNNKAAACEWLCGNRSASLIELRDGLAQDSPILKAILEMPQVQMNLSNPKILLAFLSILENENSIRVWGGDNDTTSVITHILQKYHEEKHVLGINQFYSNRQ